MSGSYRSHGLAELGARYGADGIDRTLLEGLGCTSYVAGMEIPGLHGLLTAIDLSSFGTGRPVEAYALALLEDDRRSGRLLLEGPLLGNGETCANVRIEAFVQKPLGLPARAPIETVSGAGAGKVVVIGASRGLGAAVTLRLLEQGYEVHGVFAESTSAAAELERQAGAARDRLVLHQLDAADHEAMSRLAAAVARDDESLSGLLLNAAPPPLGMRVTGEAAGELVDYVARSIRIVATPLGTLLPLLSGSDAWLGFSSSTALAEPPRDWPQYVAAKGAIEALASWAAATHPKVRTVVLRAPKLATDLANTPAGRIGAVMPQDVARRFVDYLAEAPPGLSTLLP